jgi:hypothetical protein
MHNSALSDNWHTLKVSLTELEFLKQVHPPLIIFAVADGIEAAWATEAEQQAAQEALRLRSN